MSTKNNDLPANTYTLQYHRTLQTVFGVEKAFANAFADLQILDGIQENEIAFYVKTSDTPVVIREYSKDANVGMGTGTAKSSRFGEITEIKYTTEPAEYDVELASNDGFDITTVNNNLEAAIADRLVAVAQKQTYDLNVSNGKFISEVAGHTEQLADLSDEAVLALFNKLNAYYTDNQVIVPVTAYVRPDLYNAIVDHPLVTSGKGSAVNIDKNGILEFKEFRIKKEPSIYFKEDDAAYFIPDRVLIPFVGIVMARRVEPSDFAGSLLQTLSKAGKFILDDNKKAVVKVTSAAVEG